MATALPAHLLHRLPAATITTATTRVVNVRVSNIRPQFTDLQAWCQDPSHVYIGRKGVIFIDKRRFPNVDSPYANPFRIASIKKAKIDNTRGSISGKKIAGAVAAGDDIRRAVEVVQDRRWAIEQFSKDLAARIYHDGDVEAGTAYLNELRRSLKGKVLGCWCAPEACHGDVLATVVDMESDEEVLRWAKGVLRPTDSHALRDAQP